MEHELVSPFDPASCPGVSSLLWSHSHKQFLGGSAHLGHKTKQLRKWFSIKTLAREFLELLLWLPCLTSFYLQFSSVGHAPVIPLELVQKSSFHREETSKPVCFMDPPEYVLNSAST